MPGITLFAFLVLFGVRFIEAQDNFELNEYLDNWYADRNTIPEGVADPRDWSRECPLEIYYTNRLLCYNYWRYIRAGDTSRTEFGTGLSRAFLEALDVQRLKSNVIFYRGRDGARSLRPQSHTGGVILHRGGHGTGRSSSSVGQRSNINSKVTLHKG